jgi:hypothetical protein
MCTSQLKFVAKKISQMLPRRNAAAKRRTVDDCRYLHFEGQQFLPCKLSYVMMLSKLTKAHKMKEWAEKNNYYAVISAAKDIVFVLTL